ncbi:MAG: SprT family zinc-dependent metalloprotease [Myxococcota bacterium]|jgi:predicted metal-dependent hydrolase|nr:SprT family zinc-dependent metalloprotease [Myxococcota bacterium]
MMHLTVGKTVIPYDVRRSNKAKHKRIVVTPAGVELVVPMGTNPDGFGPFMQQKRRWVFDSVREIEAKHRALLTQQYASGAKLQYRGRWLMLAVESADVPAVSITCRSKFHVQVPSSLQGLDKLEAIRAAFDAWLQDRALTDLLRVGRHHAAKLGVTPKDYRLSSARSRWGSCGRDGVIRVHWRLSQAPAAAFEYVVAHELAHMVERNHAPAFWSVLSKTLPDWPERKAMLERWESEHRAL